MRNPNLRSGSDVLKAVLGVLFLFPISVLAQKTPEFSFEERVSLINVTVTVTDRKGNLVRDLSQEDFRVYEDGKLQKISHFDNEIKPLSIGILLDTSGSMIRKIPMAEKAVARFVQTLIPEDEVVLFEYNLRPKLVQEFTNEPEDLLNAMGRIRVGGGTSFYDAVFSGLEKVRGGRHDRKVLLAVTDGLDNASRQSFEDVLEFAESSDVLIYTIGIGERKIDYDPRILEKFASATGARTFFLTPDRKGIEPEKLADAFEQIGVEIRQQYSLGYAPNSEGPREGWHKIEVKADRRGVKIRAKEGYFWP